MEAKNHQCTFFIFLWSQPYLLTPYISIAFGILFKMKCIKTFCNKYKVSDAVAINVEDERNEVKMIRRPCLCEALSLVLMFGRYTGLMPVVAVNTKHNHACKFEVSKFWLGYTCFILVFYIPYVCFMYTERLTCGPAKLHSLEWYVMTFGYIITDIESIVSLLTGAIFARKSCDFFEILSVIGSGLSDMVRAKSTITKTLKAIFPLVLFVISSYTYVAWLRFDLDFENFYCTLLDQPFAVIIRGLSLIFPSVEISIILAITAIIAIKFNSLSETTSLAIHVASTSGSSSMLTKVAKTHTEITSALKMFNKYFGIQMLMGITTSLYTTIYYLYRFCTARESHGLIISNTQERIHYLLGLFYRFSKLLIYIILGHFVGTSSQKPLDVLQNSPVINLPSKNQEQVQTLILLWQGKRGTLSGLGVINIGPWLLAPIVGNVITYLLVALQFSKSTIELPGNVTAILESIF